MTQGPFPARAAADWRRAAEAALKGASFDRLVTQTADGIALGPLHERASGARALRGEPGAWKALTRLDHPSPRDFNAQALEDVENGADGLTLVFATSRAAHGFGLRVADEAALDQALADIALDGGLRLQLDGGDAGAALAFVAVAERRGAEPPAIDVAFGLDPLGAAARDGAVAGDGLAACVKTLRARGFTGPCAAADARVVHDAGGAPAQELAFALSAGLAYLRALEDPRALEFRLAADADQLATLAKFRALRLLWGRVEQACGLDPAPIRLSASSAWRMMTAAEPFVNVMRAAMAAFAAGLGGADDVTLLPFSQALGLPDAFARRLARNTQLVELREARLGFVADPAAGAGAIEALTGGLAEKAWALFQTFEAAGGLAKALERGLVQRTVAEAAATLKRDVARAKTLITGVSAHAHLGAERPSVLPDVAAAAPASAPGALVAFRLAEPFERLRAAAGSTKVFLAAIGPLAAHTRRVGFAREVFEAGGIAAIAGDGTLDAVEIAQQFRASGASVACLCGTDEAYGEHAEGFAASLKAAGSTALYLAGRPDEREAEWRAAEIDGFLYAGADIVAALEGVLKTASS